MRLPARCTLVCALALLGACSRPQAPAVPSPTPTPPPQLAVGEPPLLIDAKTIEFHVVVRSESGTIFLPLALDAAHGKGHVAWTHPSAVAYAFDPASDAFLPGQGAPVDEYVDAVFPASPQALTIRVEYEGAPPPQESLTLRYRPLAILDLASKAYVPPAIGAPGHASKEPRHPLGDRLRGVDVARWLASGFFLRDPSPEASAAITIPAPPRGPEHG